MLLDPTEKRGRLTEQTVGAQDRWLVAALRGSDDGVEVYRGRDRQTGAEVRITALPGRLWDEPRQAAALRRVLEDTFFVEHVNVLNILEFVPPSRARSGASIRRPALVIGEAFAGETVQQRVERRGPMAVEDAVFVVTRLAVALAAAHAQGVVHGHLGPELVRLGRPWQRRVGQVKLGGFEQPPSGVLDPSPSERSLGGNWKVSAFAPPEQIRGVGLDARADVYGAGALLHYLLAGEPPFATQDGALEVLEQTVLFHLPALLEALQPDLPPELGRAVVGAMQKDPDGRPQTAEELAEILAPWCPEPEPEPEPDETSDSAVPEAAETPNWLSKQQPHGALGLEPVFTGPLPVHGPAVSESGADTVDLLETSRWTVESGPDGPSWLTDAPPIEGRDPELVSPEDRPLPLTDRSQTKILPPSVEDKPAPGPLVWAEDDATPADSHRADSPPNDPPMDQLLAAPVGGFGQMDRPSRPARDTGATTVVAPAESGRDTPGATLVAPPEEIFGEPADSDNDMTLVASADELFGDPGHGSDGGTLVASPEEVLGGLADGDADETLVASAGELFDQPADAQQLAVGGWGERARDEHPTDVYTPVPAPDTGPPCPGEDPEDFDSCPGNTTLLASHDEIFGSSQKKPK